jgi:hypothetical protein
MYGCGNSLKDCKYHKYYLKDKEAKNVKKSINKFNAKVSPIFDSIHTVEILGETLGNENEDTS